MKRIFIFSFLLFFLTAARGEDCVVVHLRSGGKMFFFIEEHPKITIENGAFCVSAQHLEISDISKYTIEDVDPSDVIRIQAEDSRSLRSVAGKVIVRPKSDNPLIQLYNIGGVACPVERRFAADGSVIIDLGGLPSGYYILKIDTETFKIQR